MQAEEELRTACVRAVRPSGSWMQGSAAALVSRSCVWADWLHSTAQCRGVRPSLSWGEREEQRVENMPHYWYGDCRVGG